MNIENKLNQIQAQLLRIFPIQNLVQRLPNGVAVSVYTQI